MAYMYANNNKYDKLAISEQCRLKFAPSVIATQLTHIFEKALKNNNLSK